MSGSRSQAGLLAQAGALLDCLERLLTGAFPVAAPVPAAALLLLITRVLSVDDVGTGEDLSTRIAALLGRRLSWGVGGLPAAMAEGGECHISQKAPPPCSGLLAVAIASVGEVGIYLFERR